MTMGQKPLSNIFDSLPVLMAQIAQDLHDELDQYLGADPEHTNDVLQW